MLNPFWYSFWASSPIIYPLVFWDLKQDNSNNVRYLYIQESCWYVVLCITVLQLKYTGKTQQTGIAYSFHGIFYLHYSPIHSYLRVNPTGLNPTVSANTLTQQSESSSVTTYVTFHASISLLNVKLNILYNEY